MKAIELVNEVQAVVDNMISDEFVNSFYFIEPVEHNDRGDATEYPKVTLIKPLRLVNTPERSVATVEMEFLQVWSPVDNQLVNAITDENLVIEDMEALAYEFLKRLRIEKPKLAWKTFDIMTVHNNWADGVSGVALTFEITTGNSIC